MDILIYSNLERLLYHLSGGNGEEIKDLMSQLDTEKAYKVSDKIKAGLGDFYGGYADVEQTNKTIGDMYTQHNDLMDTHTAVAYKVYEDYREATGDTTPTVIASTASAYKFAESVAKSIGLGEEENGFRYVEALAAKTGVRVPKGLKYLDKKEVRHTGVIDIDQMKLTVEKSI